MNEISKVEDVTSSRGAQWMGASGIIALATQALLGGNGNGNGVLGNLFGGGNCNAQNGAVASLMAENARLKSEKYSDNAALEQSNRLLQNYLKPYGDALAAGLADRAKMQAEIDCLKNTMDLKLQLAAKDVALAKQEMTCCCTANATAIAQVQAILGNITKLVVPNGAICPGWGAAEVTVKPATAAA